MTSSVLSSQSVIITTAMAVSGAVILLSLSLIKNLPSNQQIPTNQNSSNHFPLRSCLSSDNIKGQRKKKKNKRVKFADNVKDNRSGIIDARKKKNEIFVEEKIPEFRRMPANRAALYHGILRDRVHRI